MPLSGKLLLPRAHDCRAIVEIGEAKQSFEDNGLTKVDLGNEGNVFEYSFPGSNFRSP